MPKAHGSFFFSLIFYFFVFFLFFCGISYKEVLQIDDPLIHLWHAFDVS